MSNIQIFKITGVCTYEGDEDDAPCLCYPDICVSCIEDSCEFFVMYDGEVDEEEIEEY
jgi:hypothetical protein